MAGDKERFERAMSEGIDATWSEDWSEAVKHFMVAVREFPHNTDAVNNLGFALFQAGRLEEALKVYAQAHRLDSNDPLAVEKSADVLERLGRMNEAAKQHLTVADIYIARQDIEKAIDNWERATKIMPGLVKIHQRLAQAYARIGNRREAVNQYLKLAYNFQKVGNTRVALQALERARQIAPKEPTVLNAITAVNAGTVLSPDIAVPERRPTKELVAPEDDPLSDTYDVPDAHEEGPIGEAVEVAMEQLANYVFESGMMHPSGAQAMQGVEMHRAGLHEEAVEAYNEAEESGMQQPALFMNMGALLVEMGEWELARHYLEKVGADNLTLAAGAAQGLARALMAAGEWRGAARNMINTLYYVDLGLTVGDEEQSQLRQTYDRMNKLLEQANDETLRALTEKFVTRMKGADWKRRATQTRTQLEEAMAVEGGNLLEAVAQSDEVIESMNLVDEYMRNRRFMLAMDEAHRVIQKAPDYLSAHLRVAELLLEQGQIEHAIEKFNLIAQTYMVRGDEQKMADILNQVLQVAPTDIRVREHLIDLLESQNRMTEVIDQYVELARAYGEIANVTGARTAYDQALKLAERIGASREKRIEVLQSMAALDLNRLELRGALRTYQQIMELDPENLNARRQIVTLNYRLQNTVQATQELDRLLQLYARQKRPDLILKVLEEEVADNPNDMGLNSRLGAVYMQMNRREDALKRFDRLQRLQMDAGMLDEARKTLQRIISLNPADLAHYQQMLQQMP